MAKLKRLAADIPWQIPVWITIALAFTYVFSVSLRNLFTGSIPFWYDPARDVLLGVSNLHKWTLIGPPTGIPGIFYGPYWIWFLSVPLVFTRDPVLVILTVLTVPYFIFFPLLLTRLHKIWGFYVPWILWFLFWFSFNSYTTFLWNPHLAPLFFVLLSVLLGIKGEVPKRAMVFYVPIGFVAGLIVNFHFSFGLGVLVAVFLTQMLLSVLDELKQKHSARKFITDLALSFFLMGLGVALAFLPTILFESRHGFNQLRALLDTAEKSLFFNSAVVGQMGLTHTQILEKLRDLPAKILSLPPQQTIFIWAIFPVILAFSIIRKHTFFDSVGERSIFLFWIICLFSVFRIFSASRNPIWDYHFIGVETIIILMLGWAAGKSKIILVALSLWVFVLLGRNGLDYFRSFPGNPYAFPSLAGKELIVNKIYTNAGSSPFKVYAYAPAIYTYDYDYLFSWLGKNHSRSEDRSAVRIYYLIIPSTTTAIENDFINYRTPTKDFVTVWRQKMQDGTTIIKRVPRTSNLL